MQSTSKHTHRLALFALVAGLAFAPAAASAQSQLSTSDASAFLGSWSVALQTDMGPFNLDLDIVDQGGMVAATMGSADLGGSQDITDISKSGDDLIMRYSMDAQGQQVPVAVTLTPDGEGLNAMMDFADGMFTASGVATKKN
jgi:hypothetical protein